MWRCRRFISIRRISRRWYLSDPGRRGHCRPRSAIAVLRGSELGRVEYCGDVRFETFQNRRFDDSSQAAIGMRDVLAVAQREDGDARVLRIDDPVFPNAALLVGFALLVKIAATVGWIVADYFDDQISAIIISIVVR